MLETPLQVLLADDDDMFASIVQAVFQRKIGARAELRRVRDGRELLDYLDGKERFGDRSVYPLPHLVLLDERMPTLDGTQALREIRRSSRQAPLICVLSSSNQESLVARAYSVGANFCLEKPFELEQLEFKLVKVVEFLETVAELPPCQDS